MTSKVEQLKLERKNIRSQLALQLGLVAAAQRQLDRSSLDDKANIKELTQKLAQLKFEKAQLEEDELELTAQLDGAKDQIKREEREAAGIQEYQNMVSSAAANLGFLLEVVEHISEDEQAAERVSRLMIKHAGILGRTAAHIQLELQNAKKVVLAEKKAALDKAKAEASTPNLELVS